LHAGPPQARPAETARFGEVFVLLISCVEQGDYIITAETTVGSTETAAGKTETGASGGPLYPGMRLFYLQHLEMQIKEALPIDLLCFQRHTPLVTHVVITITNSLFLFSGKPGPAAGLAVSAVLQE
jgi:hypothetical protein